MATRSYRRRTPEQVISDLEAEIARQKGRLEAKEKASDPILSEIPKLQKRLRKFAQAAFDGKRNDIGNSVTAFVSSLDRIYKNG